MNNEELLAKLNETKTEAIWPVKVESIWPQAGGHPFVIGPEHFPKELWDAYLKPEQAPCADKKCRRAYTDAIHKAEQLVIFDVVATLTPEQLKSFLITHKPLLDELKVYGIGFASEAAWATVQQANKENTDEQTSQSN